MAQLLPMSEEMIASRGSAAWIARQAMRGLIQSGLALRARSFQVVPASSSSWSIEDSSCAQADFGLRDQRLALGAAGIAGAVRQARQDAVGHLLRVADDADA